MIVVRFKVRCRPENTDAVMEALRDIVLPSRAIPGVVHFDVGRDVLDPNAFIATEVFHDRASMDRQEMQPEVEKVIGLIGAGAFAAAPEWTIFEVVSARSPEH